jgi:hypothetical protein
MIPERLSQQAKNASYSTPATAAGRQSERERVSAVAESAGTFLKVQIRDFGPATTDLE